MANQLSSIDHIVVLALENRSFDQMLGFLYAGKKSPSGQDFEGLTGDESNPDANGKQVKVFKITPDMKNAYFMPGCDPGENYKQVNEQLFGDINAPSPPVATNKGFLINFTKNLPARAKNPRFGALPGTVPNNIMGMFAPETLPVMSALARGFAVCDHWFASAPTETFPNRSFMCAATSRGKLGDDEAKPYVHSKSIFGRLSDAGLTWVIYGYDAIPYAKMDFPDTMDPGPGGGFGKFKDFKAAATAGKLPAYSFLEPQWGRQGSSQHPNYDVALGEQLIHDVYYALRNGPKWAKTLFILTYDEHGGNYDHVPPPQGAIPPDDSVGEYGFDFKRFGVRVPTILISPLIAPGTVFRVPQGTMPLDHTSILKTVERRFGLLPLTARDAAASDVGDALTLAVPRNDDPLKGVEVPTSGRQPPTPNKPSLHEIKTAEGLSKLPLPDKKGVTDHELPKLRTSADYEKYIRQRMTAFDKSEQGRKAASRPRRQAGAPAVETPLAAVAPPAQIVLLRHGEKSADPRNPDLSPAGVRRADMLAGAIPRQFGRPDFLIAAAPSKNSNRPVETLTPLARALTLPIDASVPDIGYGEVAANLLHMPKYSGKLVIVCWHHGNLPDLTLDLGVPKTQIRGTQGMDGMHWETNIFNLFWSVEFPGGAPTLIVTAQPPV